MIWSNPTWYQIGLGTLSILRTEDSGPKFLFRSVLASIIRLSLPSASVMNDYLYRWKYATSKDMFVFVHHLSESHYVDTKSDDDVSNSPVIKKTTK